MPQIRSISEELQETAKRELNEVPNRIQDDINHIRNWLAQQSHIRARTDDQWILNFLRGSKFSLERTKEKLEMFYTMRTLMPTYYANRDPFQPDIQRILSEGLMLPLPKTEGDSGPRIILVRQGNLDLQTPIQAVAKTFTMINDILFYEDDNFIIGGQHLFADFYGASIQYLLTMNMNDMKKLVRCIEKAYPSRPQAFDLINTAGWHETLFSVFRPMLSDKVNKRLHVYSTCSTEEIYKIIPRSHLPREYGGECSCIPELTAYWKNKVESYRDWLVEDDQYCVDESKRAGKSNISEEMFGVEGSFRKLNLD